MNVGDEHSTSFWMTESPVIDAPTLSQDESCAVVVVGAGIAGLSVAYELASAGRSVVVIDRGEIGHGMSARTTAHLATELDDFYSELARNRSEEDARLYHQSQTAAVDRIEAICRSENIDCQFRRLDGYLIPTNEGDVGDLQEEYDVCRRVGVEVEWAERAPVPNFDTGRCLRFPNQGRFHPTRYLRGLAEAILRLGGRIYADTAYTDHEVETNFGPRSSVLPRSRIRTTPRRSGSTSKRQKQGRFGRCERSDGTTGRGRDLPLTLTGRWIITTGRSAAVHGWQRSTTPEFWQKSAVTMTASGL
jgi:hypothetical protein